MYDLNTKAITVRCKPCKYEESFLMRPGIGGRTEDRLIVSKALFSGKYGEKWKKLLEDDFELVVSIEPRIYRCTFCNHLEENYDMSLYRDATRKNDFTWANFFALCENHADWIYIPRLYEDYLCRDRGYRFVRSYIHKCPECSHRMKKISVSKKLKISCPKCGRNLLIRNSYYLN